MRPEKWPFRTAFIGLGDIVTVHWTGQARNSHGLRRAQQASLVNACIGAKSLRRLLASLVVVSCGVLAACQSDVDGIAKNVKTNDIKPPSTEVEETFGENGAEITLLLQKGPSGLYEGASRDIRDGSALSVGELGGNQAFVKVVDVTGGAASVPAAVAAAKARNSALLVSYVQPAVAAAIAAMPSDQRPPLINLDAPVPATAGNVYNLVSDEVDSAIEGVRASFASGRKKVMVFAQKDLPQAGETQLANAIRGAGGTFVGIARYDLTDASAADAVQKSRPLLQTADTVLILGRTAIATTVEGAVKAGGQSNLNFIGTSAWPPQAYAEPTANGTLIAMVEPEGASLIADRYQRHYKRPLSTEAAYGYDAVAIASGIIRTKGPEGLNAQNLTSKVGFRGVTGLFRLTPTGLVERRLSLYAISGGKLNVLAGAPSSF
jgi:predicted small secreted protein